MQVKGKITRQEKDEYTIHLLDIITHTIMRTKNIGLYPTPGEMIFIQNQCEDGMKLFLPDIKEKIHQVGETRKIKISIEWDE